MDYFKAQLFMEANNEKKVTVFLIALSCCFFKKVLKKSIQASIMSRFRQITSQNIAVALTFFRDYSILFNAIVMVYLT